MRRIFTMSMCALALVSGWILAAADCRGDGVALPPPLGLYKSTLLATDTGGRLYACDGDTVYRLSGSAFTPLYTGLVGVAVASSGIDDLQIDPSGFGVSADGARAYVASGASGRLLEVNLTTPSARDLPGTAGGWVYGNYGLAVDPIYGQVFVTDSLDNALFKVNTGGDGSLSLVKHFSGAIFGGGLTFSPTGELYVPVATGSSWPSDTLSADVYKFPRSWLDDLAAGHTPATDASLMAAGIHVSGTGTVVAGEGGAVYVEASDAIYRVAPDGTVTVVAGDPSINIFDPSMAGVGFMGLAFDPATDNLAYGYRDASTAPLGLETQATPEPATLALVGLGAAVLAWRRRKKQQC